MPISYKFRYLINDWQQHAIEVLNDKFRQQLCSTDDVLMEFADKAESVNIQNHFFEAQREIWLKMEDMSLDFHDLLVKFLGKFPDEINEQKQQLGQVCLRPRDRFWDIPVPKIDSAFDNLFVPQPSWSPSTTQQLRKLVAAPYLAPNGWTPRLDSYFASPLALCARRVSSAASRLLGSTSLRFALHGWQRAKP
ncbi:hypothetical protein [Thiolapillus sp.]|uniref:hypothetical protein n=1 Tax=Thiolapillus sp. TaxID=2017437 RepID=UPI003AF7F4F5